MNTRIIPFAPPTWESWEALMQEALREARIAMEAAEVPVGAVIADSGGNIIGRGHNRTETDTDPTAHAEILALRQAAESAGNHRLGGAVMVVTLEPCLMCAGALVHARLSGVVYGAYDAKAGAVSSCLEGLDLPFHNSGVWHMGGVEEEECSGLLHAFFSSRRGGRF